MTPQELLLYPLSLLYRSATTLHRYGARSRSFQVPIISVGGISAGGSGKTPIVRELINLLQQNYFIIILTRGYGRLSKEEIVWTAGEPIPNASLFGDEPMLLGKSLRNGMIGVGKNRSELLERILNERPKLQKPLVILDDGFQHYSIARDFNLILFDDFSATERFLLPAGYLREPHSALERADCILVTSLTAEAIARKNGRRKPDILQVQYITDRLYNWKSGIQLTSQGPRVVLVTGIARPERVVVALEKHSISIAKHLKYKDHHLYSRGDIRKILGDMKRYNAEIIISTEKDAVKLEQFPELENVLYVLPLNVTFAEPYFLLNSITKRINRKYSQE
ncbi:MAG: tetraacyldisaccharide 4'-kinase [Chlorobi bacterium]|nr:tetraacyldisaccharide 4'-kinase [Chlorobiota bacterium]